MLKPLTSVLLWILLLSHVVSAQEKPLPIGFHAAFLNVSGEMPEIRFDSFFQVDWGQTARENFRLFDPNHPDLEQIRKHEGSIMRLSTIEYDAPIPTAWRKVGYYLITEKGLVALDSARLIGTITYETDGAGNLANEPPRFSGKVAARLTGEANYSDAAFVLMSEMPQKSSSSNVSLFVAQNSSDGILTYIESERVVNAYMYWHWAVLEHSSDFKDFGPRTAYELSISGASGVYLFVHWTTGCGLGAQRAYSLFRVEREDNAVEVANQIFRCNPGI